MHPTTLQAFSEELQKIAQKRHTIHDELHHVKKELSPGDVLATKLRAGPIGIEQKLVQKGLKFFGGTAYPHTALYVGNGRVVDAGKWDHEGVKQKGYVVADVPLTTFAKRYKFRVLEIKASLAQKKDAISFAKEQIGKKFDVKKLFRLALPVEESKEPRARQEKLDAMICSQLVSNAYHEVPFGKKRSIEHVRPIDIQKSPYSRVVAELS